MTTDFTGFGLLGLLGLLKLWLTLISKVVLKSLGS
jgi:hypothetical protein